MRVSEGSFGAALVIMAYWFGPGWDSFKPFRSVLQFRRNLQIPVGFLQNVGGNVVGPPSRPKEQVFK